jgi:Winged helix-turn helix
MRMGAIAKTLDGADRETAARRGDMSDQALRDAIKRYNVNRIEGPHDRPRTGRPTKLSEAQRVAIVVKGPEVEAEGLSAYLRGRPFPKRCCGAAAPFADLGAVLGRRDVNAERSSRVYSRLR